jgi:hypothetical protein
MMEIVVADRKWLTSRGTGSEKYGSLTCTWQSFCSLHAEKMKTIHPVRLPEHKLLLFVYLSSKSLKNVCG